VSAPVGVSLHVNGDRVEVAVDPRLSLADLLREELDLVGTHLGCEHGVCGACTVLIDNEPARSCTVLAASLADATVRTVEDLAEGNELSLAQRVFHEHHGLQCGFCTPGFMTSLTYLLDRPIRPTAQEVEETLEGVACRCTGYVNIRSAAEAAVSERFGVLEP
jgi:aerobic-type carbon monoxide dehydrogenase small subunit (CoxS/CutS family)